MTSNGSKWNFFWSTLCFLRNFGQNEEVKIRHLQLNKAKNESWSNFKKKTIFPISSLSWFQKCQNFWKKFIFWKKLPQKTSTGSLAVRFFFFKKLHLINVWLSTSLKKSFDSFQKLKILHLKIESAVAIYPSCPGKTFSGFWLSIT